MIEFKNVSKMYPGAANKALSDVNIRIEKGEFVFVVGSSGAGKSTFLKLIMHEEKPSEGEVIVNGYSSSKMRRREIPYYRRTMGIVFQDFRLIPKMSVYDNVAFAMRVIGSREKEIRKRVPYILGLVGLAQKARSMPNELSGGEQQRVALARALVNNPKLIIADEPTGNVDPEMSREIVDLLTKINNRGTTVVMVTHEHDLVRHFKRRVIVIKNGQVASDTPDPTNAQFDTVEPQKDYDMFFFDEDTNIGSKPIDSVVNPYNDEGLQEVITAEQENEKNNENSEISNESSVDSDDLKSIFDDIAASREKRGEQ